MELRFTGSVAESYDKMMVPLIFQPYADELARRAQQWRPARILETAAGTGVVTKALHDALPDAQIVATDLNQPMIDVASKRIQSDRIRFVQANAQELSFADGSFDLVVCQFGAMFFPDRVLAYSEARRTLKPGGRYILAIWDKIERNRLSDEAQRALIDLFPGDPPLFMREGPFGYHDPTGIVADLHSAGFQAISVETLEMRSRGTSAGDVARAFCFGTPMGVEVEELKPGSLDEVFAAVERRLSALQGPNGIDEPMSAHIVTATK